LKALRRHVHGKLLLFWDGLPAHRAKVVQDYIKSQQSWLRVERLPAYAPELNPVEYLWSASKRKDLANICPDNITELDGYFKKSARRYGRDEEKLKGFLQASGLFT
jgi:transposase